MRFFLVLIATILSVISAEQFDNRIRRTILDTHNYNRAAVVPTSSDMKKLEWSLVLETMASYTAAQCVEQERNEGNKEGCGGFGAVGYNQGFAKYVSRPDYSTYEDLVRSWYDLGGYYNFDYNLCYAEEEYTCAAYLQAVFANVTAVGCASNMCYMDVKDDGQYIGTVLVCYYTPGWIMNPEEDDNNNNNNNNNGNDNGLSSPRPYTQGTSCQKCLSDAPYCYRGLCSPYYDAYGAGSIVSHSGLLMLALTAMVLGIFSYL